MKAKFLIVILAGLMIFSPDYSHAQKKDKKKPRKEVLAGAKNLRTVLNRMYKNANKKLKLKEPCGKTALAFLKKIPKKNLTPSEEELGRTLDAFVKKLDFNDYPGYNGGVNELDAMATTSNFEDYYKKAYKSDPKTLKPADVKRNKESYKKLKVLFDEGITIYNKSFSAKPCKYSIETSIFPLKWKKGFVKDSRAMTVDWVIKSKITIGCTCVTGSVTEVKNAVFQFSGNSTGAMRTSYVRQPGGVWWSFNGFDSFGKLTNAKLKMFQLNCCSAEDVKPEDGSFVQPEDENISTDQTILDVGIGAKFEKDVETMTTATAGALFNVVPQGNPFYVGGRVNLCTTALSGSDVTETLFRIGPAAEYQLPVGQNDIRLLGGVNAGYVAGSVDAFGFKTNISGIGGDIYAGVQIPLTPAIDIGAVVSLFDYTNLTFKPKGEEGIKSTASNSIFVTDRPNISLRLRFDLEPKK